MITNERKRVIVEKEMETENENFRMQIDKIKLEYEKTIEELTNAFERVKNEGLRKIYESERNKNNSSSKERILLKDTIYDFFGISEAKIYSLSEDKANNLIKEIFDNKMKEYETLLNDDSIKEKQKDHIRKLKIRSERNYASISTQDKRRLYKEILDKQELEKKRQIKEMEIKSKYSKIDQFNPDLIQTISSGKAKGEKLVLIKKSDKPIVIDLKTNRNIKLKKTAEVAYRNSTGVYDSYLYEYKISRLLNNKEKIDRIYTDLDISKLSINKKTGQPEDKQYYNCVVNELLSEEVIRGSKYNGGYIGLIESDNVSGYRITLGDKKLSDDEKENLAAIILLKERKEKRLQIKKEQEEGER